MENLQSLPALIPGSAEQQASEIYALLSKNTKIFYRPLNDLPLNQSVKTLLESKGYTVMEQNKYHLTWTDDGPVRGAFKRRVYWIGVLGHRV
jgi:hypothetical protein